MAFIVSNPTTGMVHVDTVASRITNCGYRPPTEPEEASLEQVRELDCQGVLCKSCLKSFDRHAQQHQCEPIRMHPDGKRVYVASSWRNERQPEVVAALRAAGHEVYDFRDPDVENKGFHWSDIDPEWQSWTPEQFIGVLKHPLAVNGFDSDMWALRTCEVCVLVMPCGRSAHLELGWAAGAGKRTIILLSGGEPELMYSMADYLVTSKEELIEVLRRDK